MPLGDAGFEQLRQGSRDLEAHLGFAPATLVPFLRRAALPGDTATSMDTVLAQVADRPPRTWDDTAVERFQTQARVIGGLFREMVAQSGSLTERDLVPDEAIQHDAGECTQTLFVQRLDTGVARRRDTKALRRMIYSAQALAPRQEQTGERWLVAQKQ